MLAKDTIVAPATPAGEGGVAIIRLSGPLSLSLLHKTFLPATAGTEFSSHRLHYGKIVREDGSILDEVMAVFMQAPRTYTRENVVEVHCHGSNRIVQRIVDLYVDHGARIASPGEFTLRAFLNGRLDLSQAEGVIDLIKARSEASQRIALSQVGGRISQFIHGLRDTLAEQLALLETYVDFPEEDISVTHLDMVRSGASSVLAEVRTVLNGFESGRILREGLSLLILGRPNVGKSSLLNRLLGEERAIVTDLAGTTRDTIEERVDLGGIPVRVIDTAGIRITDDPVEAEGVRRARSRAAEADLILLVVDGSVGITADDQLVLEDIESERVLLVVNKNDLGSVPLKTPFDKFPKVSVCARSGEGMAPLIERLQEQVLGDKSGGEEEPMLSDRRHRDALVRCGHNLEQFVIGLENLISVEFLALELREALDHLGEITGETTPDDILNRIFDRFCIGK